MQLLFSVTGKTEGYCCRIFQRRQQSGTDQGAASGAAGTDSGVFWGVKRKAGTDPAAGKGSFCNGAATEAVLQSGDT